ncbi:MAG: S9 family peptidase [Bacteroidales bacterium]|nr:S9 family peptidase [Bacteroidales bacterium]
MKKYFITGLAALTLTFGAATAKRVLDHSSFDNWKSVKNSELSRDGRWAAYSEVPQEGDALLTIHDTRTGKNILIPRGYNPKFTANSKWAVALIKPLFADTRKAKIDKKKDLDMPQDSLAIIDLSSGKVTRIADVTAFKLGKKGGEWIAYTCVDTTLLKPKSKERKDKKAGRPLVVRDLATGNSKTIKNVKEYVFSEDGMNLGVTLRKAEKDSLSTDGVGVMLLPDTSFILIDRDRKYYGAPTFDVAGKRLAYTASMDSTESGTLRADLFLADINRTSSITPRLIPTSRTERAPINLALPHAADAAQQAELQEQRAKAIKASAGDSLFVNQYSPLLFSHNGKRLIVGVAPYVCPDDTTIVDFERADLDIWRWDAPQTPPQELKNVEKARSHTFPLVIDLESGRDCLLTTNPLVAIYDPDRWDADWAMIADPTKEKISHQWNYLAPEEISVINVLTGKMVPVTTAMKEGTELSPADRFILIYDDRNYYAYEIATGKTVPLTTDIPYPIWDETTDYAMMQAPYGTAGWTEGDDAVLIYDKHDIWSVDPTGNRKPVCLTAGYGRKNNLRFRYVKTDPEERAIKNGQQMLLRVFDYGDKRHGLATLTAGKAANPDIRILDGYQFSQIKKAENAPVITFTKQNFSTCPDIYLAKNADFAKAQRLTDTDSQRDEYWWGTAELVKWYAYDGREVEGILYKPGNFDASKKYPMIAYFYEQNSEELYRHYTMEPSWSWINFPFYTSRGYAIFVPDVHYTPGVPGEGAYNCIVSGVEELCKRYDWIDKDHIGIDGQSWGGYQTAYLVTRTNMFACAGSGAPVANMTSAFGGIRWESGDSRQVQYEQGQSRIGRNLWDAPELYLANSPLFKLDRVNTPLLIMHNDADGAVPWYQGIELFMGLRRLHKPVWMLQYNGEAHNIRARKNRKDITIRFQQFFDHFLQGAPMPEWMKYGIPATRKGQEMRTGLVEE